MAGWRRPRRAAHARAVRPGVEPEPASRGRSAGEEVRRLPRRSSVPSGGRGRERRFYLPPSRKASVSKGRGGL